MHLPAPAVQATYQCNTPCDNLQVNHTVAHTRTSPLPASPLPASPLPACYVHLPLLPIMYLHNHHLNVWVVSHPPTPTSQVEYLSSLNVEVTKDRKRQILADILVWAEITQPQYEAEARR